MVDRDVDNYNILEIPLFLCAGPNRGAGLWLSWFVATPGGWTIG